MRNSSVWRRAFGLTATVVDEVGFDERVDAVIVSVRPSAKVRRRCGRCGRRSPRYDRGEGRRRWRALDLGTTRVFIEAEAPRVRCRAHGPTVAQVPWARHGAGHTRDFDDQAAWLAVHVSKSAVVEVLRVAWRTVGAIVARVSGDIDARVDRLAGLRRIGIDEVSYKRGFSYLSVVVDHDSGRLVWAAPGRDDATVARFFDELGAERSAALTHVTADLAPWIRRVVEARAPQAVSCADPFHVVAWAIEALDVERRRAWNEAPGRHHQKGELDQQRRRAGPDDQTVTVGAMEEPGTPHRASTPPARLDRQDRPPTVAGLPTQRRTALRLHRQRRRRQSGTRPLDPVGPTITTTSIHRAATTHRHPPRQRSTPPSTPACPTPSPRRPTPRSGCSHESPSGSTDPNR